MSGMLDLASWYGYMVQWKVRDAIREMWLSIPGPRWFKVLVMAVLLAQFVIPGPDEVVILVILAVFRRMRARKVARNG